MGDLDHPNVVNATDAGTWNGQQYLAMNYVDGLPLNKLVARFSPLQVSTSCELVRQAAVGMQHVHEKGWTHRDLKPSNLMLDQSGVVKILDLGLARLITNTESSSEQITASNQMMGTYDYMSPEQWEDSRSVDIRADIYSLGCTLFCLLSGRPPFGDLCSVIAKMRAHTSTEAPNVSSQRKNLPDGLSLIVQTCLSKSPDQRFQTPKDLAVALEPFTDSANLALLLRDTLSLSARPQALPTGNRSSESPLPPATSNPEDQSPRQSARRHPSSIVSTLPLDANLMFVYGSLLDADSLTRTLSDRSGAIDYLPAELRSYRREWGVPMNRLNLVDREWSSIEGLEWESLVVRPSATDRVPGAIISVSDDELTALTKREGNYHLKDVTDHVEMRNAPMFMPDKVLTFVPNDGVESNGSNRSARRGYISMVEQALTTMGFEPADASITHPNPVDAEDADVQVQQLWEDNRKKLPEVAATLNDLISRNKGGRARGARTLLPPTVVRPVVLNEHTHSYVCRGVTLESCV